MVLAGVAGGTVEAVEDGQFRLDDRGGGLDESHRLARGERLHLKRSIGPDGIGVTTSEIFDRDGFIGTSAQTLLIQRR